MFSFSTVFSQLMSKIIAVLFSVLYVGSGTIGGISKSTEKTPNDFTPVLRFAICSDIHLNGEEDQDEAKDFANLFVDSYAYAESQSYNKLDAVLVAGDFATSGKDSEYQMFNKIASENKKSETQVLTVIGNHEFFEYRDTDPSLTYDAYKKNISEDIDFHVVINGYHFIGVSYSENGKTFTSKMNWLNSELKKATKDDPSKPVFVMNHPAPFATVYGSVNWCSIELKTVLSNYPQVVDFSGHSHYCSSDPRSIWQGEFTAVGCGSLHAFMSNLNYIEGQENLDGESGGFWIVEADADGNVRLKLYDIVNRMFFDNVEYYLSDVSKITNRTYSWLNNSIRDTKPKFDNGEITTETNENGETVISFPDASGYYEAENYKITVSDGIKTVWDSTVVSNYGRAVKSGMNVNIGKIKSGSYTVRITAVSPYSKVGETIKADFSV